MYFRFHSGSHEAVREPEHEQVLDRLLAEVVIDPERLRFVEHPGDSAVQLARGIEVVPERLLDDDARERLGRRRLQQPRRFEIREDRLELARRRGEIEQPVTLEAALLVETLELALETLVRVDIGEITRHVVQTRREVLGVLLVAGGGGREPPQRVAHVGAERLGGEWAAPTPTAAKWSVIEPARTSLKIAGMSLRCVRSPVAPNTTNAHGGAMRGAPIVFGRRDGFDACGRHQRPRHVARPRFDPNSMVPPRATPRPSRRDA